MGCVEQLRSLCSEELGKRVHVDLRCDRWSVRVPGRKRAVAIQPKNIRLIQETICKGKNSAQPQIPHVDSCQSESDAEGGGGTQPRSHGAR